jgi:hypothetical protein
MQVTTECNITFQRWTFTPVFRTLKGKILIPKSETNPKFKISKPKGRGVIRMRVRFEFRVSGLIFSHHEKNFRGTDATNTTY